MKPSSETTAMDALKKLHLVLTALFGLSFLYLYSV